MEKLWDLKAILLDFDGTIVDATWAYLNAAKIALADQGIDPEGVSVADAREISRRIELGLPIFEILKVSNLDYGRFLRCWGRSLRTSFDGFSLIQGARDVIRWLSKRYKLALVTNRSIPQAHLAHLGLEEFFATKVSARELGGRKPSPATLLIAAERLSVPICSSVMVGDSIVDVRAGKAAGSRTISVLSGLYDASALKAEHPDFVIMDLTDLPAILSA